MKGHTNIISTTFNDICTVDDIVNLFADKYSTLYNNMLYDQDEISDIKCLIYDQLYNGVD